jgi:hypothetical protein
MGSQLGLAGFLGRRDSLVDGIRRAAEQRARRRLPAAAAGRLDPPAGAVVVDGAGEVERLAPLPHQDRPPPQGALLSPAAAAVPAIAGSATAVSRHELPTEAGAAAPPEPAREAARAGHHGDGHFAQEAAGHGSSWSVVRWKVLRKYSNLPGGGSHLLMERQI